MAPLYDRKTYYQRHRELFGRLNQGQVDGLETVISFLRQDPQITDIRLAAYLLATAWHETARTMQPIAERGSTTYFKRYDPTNKDRARAATARRMGNTQPGDGYRYRGRGYVQVTWRVNYRRLAEATGLSLETDPDLAMDPAVAYVALARGCLEGWWTGRELGDYITDTRTDYRGARRVVNGTDRADDIADYAVKFERCLAAALYAAHPLRPRAHDGDPLDPPPPATRSA